jgi:hypothetical protein
MTNPIQRRAEALEHLITEALAIEAQSAQEAGALGFMARALVQATLPHRKTAGTEFLRRNGTFTLSLLAPSTVGLPYGTVPRLLLAWMTTEAVRTHTRELELGDTLSGFMRELGLVPTGGRWGTIPRLKDQARRLFASTVSATFDDADKHASLGYRLADRALLWWDAKAPNQAGLWRSTVTLTDGFYQEIVAHPVPVDMRAMRALKRSPLALDIYCWLTYRTSYATRPSTIPWGALALQFGSDYGRLRAFKAAFLAELRKVMLVYRGANVEPLETGLLLKPARPHVARRPAP